MLIEWSSSQIDINFLLSILACFNFFPLKSIDWIQIAFLWLFLRRAFELWVYILADPHIVCCKENINKNSVAIRGKNITAYAHSRIRFQVINGTLIIIELIKPVVDTWNLIYTKRYVTT